MNLIILVSLIVGVCASVTHAGHEHQGYFSYANVPAPGQYEFGYHRGNAHHYTSRYEQGHGWRARTKVRWGDKKGGYGEHYFDYNHGEKKGHDKGWGHKAHHGWQPTHHVSQHHGHHHHSHHHDHGSFSENIPAVVEPQSQLQHRRSTQSQSQPRSQTQNPAQRRSTRRNSFNVPSWQHY